MSDETMNPPAGDTENSEGEWTDAELADLLEGAELLRYTDGTGEHEGNVMAVFRTTDDRGIGLTFRTDRSIYPDELIGETVDFIETHGNRGIIDFGLTIDQVAGASHQIEARETVAFGLYEVDL